MSRDWPLGARETRRIRADDLHAEFSRLVADGFRPALVAGHDDGDSLRVVYLLVASGPDRRIELELVLDRDRPMLPSLAAHSFPTSRFEREIADLFGVELVDHPSPHRLVLHQHWPPGYHPMRRDTTTRPVFDERAEPFPFVAVEGPGVYEIPVGPIHAGLIEPGHFRFSVVGETIVAMKARLWFVHKGIERLFEGRIPGDGIELAERISGDTAVGHSLAYCLAVEEALDLRVPNDVQELRAVLLELERLYNHVADLGALCNDVGYGILHAHAFTLRERLLRLNRRVTGHRLLRGAITPGGAQVRDLPTTDELSDVAADADELVRLALANSTVVDRFTGTSVLHATTADDIGTVGYVARASGLDRDARRDHPFCDLSDVLDVPVQGAGDVMARFRQRAQEITASIELLHALLGRARKRGEPEPLRAASDRTGGSSGVGIVEAWRGALAHRVEVGTDGRLHRVKIVDPSFLNWPALPMSLGDTIVPDFPLTNKSFNLSYAGNDL
jgi:Ni,Fe-hydrogenase III large subunit/Ni,Fe-hydrogenase III component G